MATLTLRRPRHRWQRVLRDTVRYTIIYGLLAAIGSVILLPLLWTVSSSLKPYGSGIKFPPQFIPERFVWENYPKVIQTIPFLRFLRNSLFVTGLSTLGELLSC